MRPAVGEHEKIMDEAAYYFLFADSFGWTPSTVDDLPVLYAEAMLTIFAERAALRDQQPARPNRRG